MAPESGVKQISRLPVHVAIVPDGNGRWAERRGLPRLAGHKAGSENMRSVVKWLNDYKIKYVTLYGFSTENWSRPREEVEGLFRILGDRINGDVPQLHKWGVKLRHLGRFGELPPHLQEAISHAVEVTKNNTGMVLSLAFNYGGKGEILDAVTRLLAERVPPEKLDEKLFSRYLYTDGLPDVDLLIRTGDERRLSNFLLWQTAYSEYYFTEVLWPDFDKDDVDKALITYSQRNRRFGGL